MEYNNKRKWVALETATSLWVESPSLRKRASKSSSKKINLFPFSQAAIGE